MSDKQKFDAVLVEEIAWVKPIDSTHVAFHLTDGTNSEVFLLDGTQAAKLAGGLMAHMPAPSGTELGFKIPEGLSGEHRVTGTDVQIQDSLPQDAQNALFSLTLKLGKEQELTMTMTHQELLRWIGQMQAKAAEHHRRNAN